MARLAAPPTRSWSSCFPAAATVTGVMVLTRIPTAPEVLGVALVIAGHGLIRDAGAINYPGTTGPSTWRIAALGRRCLFLLDTDREDLR